MKESSSSGSCLYCKDHGKSETHMIPSTTRPASRLSSCKSYRQAPGGNEERATFVQKIDECVLSLGLKCDQKAANCTAMACQAGG